MDVHPAYAVAKEFGALPAGLIGDAGLRQMFELRASGMPLDAAFAKAAGFSVLDFQARFIESLRPKYYDRAR